MVGVSGSGKTTLAAAVAARLGVPHVELDAIFHLPGWTELDDVGFASQVTMATAGPGWVVDGNYSRIRDIVWAQADTVIVLDLPRRRVMGQLLRRTLGRMATRRELWNGNRERWRNLLRLDPNENILRWAWTTHAHNRDRYRAAAADPRWAHLRFVTVRSRQDIQRLVDTVPAPR